MLKKRVLMTKIRAVRGGAEGIMASYEPDIEGVVSELYDSKKDNIKVVVMDSLKTMLKSEMPPELIIQNILNDILRDDKLCKNRIILEIKLHQSKEDDKVQYSKIM